MLSSAMGPGAAGTPSPVAPVAGASGPGAAIVAAASGEVGQAELPPGSNDSPRIAQYRAATAGAPGPGPWCAYFTSWACRQAGVPLGDHGEGFGSVDALYSWAQRSGRAAPAGSGYVPKPGDLIVFHEHIGIVENVLPKRADPDDRGQLLRPGVPPHPCAGRRRRLRADRLMHVQWT